MAKKTKYSQSNIDLWDLLKEQLRFLKNSNASYDDGFEGEAKRLAVTIRVLVYDTNNSTSLLYQLVIKHKLKMLNTASQMIPNNLLGHQGLVIMKVQAPPGASVFVSPTIVGEETETHESILGVQPGNVTYEPIINVPPNPHLSPSWVSFTRWWKEIVIKTAEGTTFTREQLVLAMANKDGGAHVDPKLDSDYANLTKFNSQGWTVDTDGSTDAPDNSIADASVRQIAFELEQSLLASFGNDDGELAPFLQA